MERLGWRNEEIRSSGNAGVVTCRILYKDLPVLGSIIKVQHPAAVPFGDLEVVAKKHRALFLKIEPDLGGPAPETFAKQGFVPDNWPLTPTKVIRVDLRPSLDELWRKLAKDARYSVRKAEQNGIVTEVTALNDGDSAQKKLKEFYKIFKSTGHAKGFWIPARREITAKGEAFAANAFLIIGRFGEEALSGAFIIFNGQTAYYEHAASTLLGRKLLAQYLVMWTLIKLAKNRGCTLLDLGGIADPRFKISRRWESLSVFKAKFCGETVTYPGSFTKYYNRLVRFLFRFNF